MNHRTPLLLLAAILALLFDPRLPLLAAEDLGDLTRYKDALGFRKPVPVNISGFTGEADAVLKNDLVFMGVQHVPLEQAQYLVTGGNAGRIEGRLVNKATRNQLFAKAYTGGSTRAQTHAFADDIAKALQLPAIAQTKMAFKAEAGPGRSEVYIADYDGHGAQAVRGVDDDGKE